MPIFLSICVRHGYIAIFNFTIRNKRVPLWKDSYAVIFKTTYVQQNTSTANENIGFSFSELV